MSKLKYTTQLDEDTYNKNIIEEVLTHDNSSSIIESSIKSAGDQNHYQYRLIFFLGMHWLFSSFIIMGHPFFFLPPRFRCQNGESNFYPCKEIDGGCQSKAIDPNSPITVATEFELFCENNHKRYIASTLFFLGVSFLSLFYAYLADLKGFFIFFNDNG